MLPRDVTDHIISLIDTSSPGGCASLASCAAASRVLYWPTRAALFRTFDLQISRPRPPQLISSNSPSSVKPHLPYTLTPFSALTLAQAHKRVLLLHSIITTSPHLLPLVRCLHITVDPHRLLLACPQLFQILEALSEQSFRLTRIRVTGTANAWGEAWRWLGGMKAPDAAVLERLMGKQSVKTLVIEGISLKTSVADFLSLIPWVEKVELKRVCVRRANGHITPQTSQGEINAGARHIQGTESGHIRSIAFTIESDEDIAMASTVLVRLDGLENLKLSYPNTFYPPSSSAALLPNTRSPLGKLRHLHYDLPLSLPSPTDVLGAVGSNVLLPPGIDAPWGANIDTLQLTLSTTEPIDLGSAIEGSPTFTLASSSDFSSVMLSLDDVDQPRVLNPLSVHPRLRQVSVSVDADVRIPSTVRIDSELDSSARSPDDASIEAAKLVKSELYRAENSIRSWVSCSLLGISASGLHKEARMGSAYECRGVNIRSVEVDVEVRGVY